MTCDPARIIDMGRDKLAERHVWRRSWRERLFGTVPLKKCECGRVCWMDRRERRYRWTA
jgi:hypothetical protein